MSFFAELKRRNVFRVGIAYVVIGWLLAQVAEFLFENFGAPEWALRTFAIFLFLGLPLALFFAWAFEVTPEGIKLEKNVDRSQSITAQTGRKLDFVIIGVLVVAVSFLLVDKFLLSESTPPSEEIIATESQSIAVLPFVNMSDDADHFADGLSEELLNLLAKIPDLKVAGRTSSFAFKGRNEDFRAIGDALKVEHVLEGSVRRSGDTLRVTAQLIKVEDGYHVWSESYDRKMADIFAIQDDVAGAITQALRLRLSPQSHKRTPNTEAYALYLQALPYVATNDDPNVIEIVMPLIDRAIELDPEFAKAHELKAMAYWMTAGEKVDARMARPLVHKSATTALELDGTLVLARLLAQTSGLELQSWSEDIEAIHAALEAAPDDFNIYRFQCYLLIYTGYLQESLECTERLIELEPLSSLGYWRAAMAYSALGRRSKARESWQRALDLGGPFFTWDLAFDHVMAGEYDAAINVLENAQEVFYAWDASDVRQVVAAAADPDNSEVLLDSWFDVALAGANDYTETNGVYFWYLALGRLDDYWHAIEDVGAEDNYAWTNTDYLLQFGIAFPQTGFTRHPEYLKFAKAAGLVELWDTKGAPDHCSKESGGWVCE